MNIPVLLVVYQIFSHATSVRESYLLYLHTKTRNNMFLNKFHFLLFMDISQC
jgi:hypothetical protein